MDEFSDAVAARIKDLFDGNIRVVSTEARIEIHQPSHDEIETRGHRVLQCRHPRFERGHAGGARNGQYSKHDAVKDDGHPDRQVYLDVVHICYEYTLHTPHKSPSPAPAKFGHHR